MDNTQKVYVLRVKFGGNILNLHFTSAEGERAVYEALLRELGEHPGFETVRYSSQLLDDKAAFMELIGALSKIHTLKFGGIQN